MNTSTPTIDDAIRLHRAGDLGAAETAYRRILSEDSRSAAALQGLGVIALQSGNPAAAIPLFDQASAYEPAWMDPLSNRGLALSRLGRLEEALLCLRQVVEHEPGSSSALVNLANTLAADNRTDEAVDTYRRALEIDPNSVEASVNLGNLYSERGDGEVAVTLLESALNGAPDNAQIMSSLGSALARHGESEKALEVLRRALRHQPEFAPAHFNIGMALMDLGELAAAEEHFRQAINLHPDFARAHHNLAHLLLIKGELAAGWEAYQWRWRAKKDVAMPADYRAPLWDGSSLQGKTIAVWGEQGLGDKIMFYGHLWYLLDLGAKVIVETESRLAALTSRSFPEITVVVRGPDAPPSPVIQDADFQVPAGDLARWAWPSIETVTPMGCYLVADEGKTQQIRQRYRAGGEAPLIGLSWASRPPKGIALENLLGGLQLGNVSYVSLQYGDHAEEIAEASQTTGVDVISDVSIDPISDVDGSAAQLAAMDAIVTIQNATLFTAGALGVPTFALVSPIPDWRWFGGQRSPWHQSVRLYHTKRGDGFEQALMRLRTDLTAAIH